MASSSSTFVCSPSIGANPDGSLGDMRILMLAAVVALLPPTGSASRFATGDAPGAGPPRVTADAGPRSFGSSADIALTGTAAPTYRTPITGPLRVLVPFQPPPTPYAAGHRGVDLAAAQASMIVAAGAGVVRFAGIVAGRGVVVIQHPDGISTEYEPVRPAVETGEVVTAGEPIGQLTGRHRACRPSDCLHWGARRGEFYLDPMSLLQPLGVVRLLPW